jgi:hypothetical protein
MSEAYAQQADAKKPCHTVKLSGALWDSDGESEGVWLNISVEGPCSLYELEARVLLVERLCEDEVVILYVEKHTMDKRLERALEALVDRFVAENQDLCCRAVCGAYSRRGFWKAA